MAVSAIPGTMRVPRFPGEGRIDYVEVPVPEPGPGELLLDVRANALCGTERRQIVGGAAVTPGHEAAGIVVVAGPGTSTPAGTPGVVYLMDVCRACRSCRLGLTNQCLHKRGDMGLNRDGGYGAYELVHENVFFPVHADLPLAEATMLLDVMGTGGHAVKRAQLVHPDIQAVVVAGAGPMGLGVLAVIRIRLGEGVPVAITDVSPYRFSLAEQLGGLPVRVDQETPHAGRRRLGLDAVDLAIDTSGRRVARQACLHSLARRGVLVCVGHGEGLTLEVSPDLIAPERAVLGSEYFCYGELAENLEHLRAHRDYLAPIVSHRFPIGEIERAFQVSFAGESGKVVVEQGPGTCL